MSPLAFVHAQALCPDRDRMEIRRVSDATVIIEQGRISAIVPGGEAPPQARVIDARGRLLTPGLIDCHTHLLFLGNRAAEFCERAAGASYLQIAERGGGIRSTVRATREGSSAERTERARERLRRLARQGVTTVEVKSGYGLSAEHELRHLEEIRGLTEPALPRVTATALAAHAVPPEVRTATERADWVRRIAEEIIPEVARRGLASRIDAFVERSAYSPEEARLIAATAQRHGLAVHLHVDQLTDGGGAALAAELGAQAVSHLERVSPSGIAALAQSKAIAVLLPTATLAAGEPNYAPARALIEAGIPIALATNLNPGTGPTESTSLMFFLAAIGLKMTPEEILWACTRGGARALGTEDLGLVEPGAPADLVLWNATDPAHLPYHAAVNHVRLVLREGSVIADRSGEVELDCDGLL